MAQQQITLANYSDLEGVMYATDTDEPTGEVTFTSYDTTLDPSSTESVELLTSSDTWGSRFQKISQMFKNIRYLLKMLGTTNISSIGNGTVTGALSTLNSNLTASLDPHTSTDGSGFNKNFKQVNLNDQFSSYHHRWYFSFDQTSKSNFSNIPTVLNAISSGTIMGYREVYYRSNIHIGVVVHELYPVAGREHYCFYNNGSWTAWKCYNNVGGLLLNEDRSDTENMPASSQTDFTISISKTGYTPVGIVSISKSGGNSGNAIVGGFRFDSSSAVISMRNITSSALSSITITVKVLYIINA